MRKERKAVTISGVTIQGGPGDDNYWYVTIAVNNGGSSGGTWVHASEAEKLGKALILHSKKTPLTKKRKLTNKNKNTSLD